MISSITLSLPVELAEEIKKFSREKDIFVSEILREGAMLFMKKKNEKRK